MEENLEPQAPIQDKTKLLYDAVSKDYNIGTYDDFSKKLQDSSKRKAFYDGVGTEYNLGTFDDFSAKIGEVDLKKKTKKFHFPFLLLLNHYRQTLKKVKLLLRKVF